MVDERSAPGRGVLLGREDFERISAPDEINADVLIVWADGVDPSAANAELEEATGTEVFAPRLPSDVNNLREVEAAASCAWPRSSPCSPRSPSSTRSSRRCGCAGRTSPCSARSASSAGSSASTLVWQATTIGVIGLVVGVPLGLVVGRVVWRAVASGIGVVDDPVTPALAVAVVVIAALAIVMAAAVVPSRSARKCRRRPRCSRSG